MDFDTNGRWNSEAAEGPAIHTPDNIKAIAVTNFRVEWLNASEPEQGFYAKNHIVASIEFAEDQVINGETYRSARLSVELGPDVVVSHSDVGDHLEPGRDYLSAVYTLALHKYSGPTFRSLNNRTYSLNDGVTIGSLINKVIARRMHHFLFLPYTNEGRWKGCGDHLLHTWAVFVRDGDITDRASAENPNVDLSTELTTTYIEGASTHELLGRGWWLRHNPVQDDLTPESVFSSARLTYQLPVRQAASD